MTERHRTWLSDESGTSECASEWWKNLSVPQWLAAMKLAETQNHRNNQNYWFIKPFCLWDPTCFPTSKPVFQHFFNQRLWAVLSSWCRPHDLFASRTLRSWAHQSRSDERKVVTFNFCYYLILIPNIVLNFHSSSKLKLIHLDCSKGAWLMWAIVASRYTLLI